MTASLGSKLPLVLPDSLLPSLLVAIPERRGNDDRSLLTDIQHPVHPHARMRQPRRKTPLCPKEAPTTQELVDQVEAKGNGLLYSSIDQDDHKHESSPQVLTTRSQKQGTLPLQAQEMPTGLPLTHSHHDHYLGKQYFQNAARK